MFKFAVRLGKAAISHSFYWLHCKRTNKLKPWKEVTSWQWRKQTVSPGFLGRWCACWSCDCVRHCVRPSLALLPHPRPPSRSSHSSHSQRICCSCSPAEHRNYSLGFFLQEIFNFTCTTAICNVGNWDNIFMQESSCLAPNLKLKKAI